MSLLSRRALQTSIAIAALGLGGLSPVALARHGADDPAGHDAGDDHGVHVGPHDSGADDSGHHSGADDSGHHSGSSATEAAAGRVARETLADFRITGTPSARAGTVTFRVKNSGAMPHELVVIRTSRRAAKLPMAGGRASERGRVGEVEVAAGKTKTLNVKLGKGHYALICNIGNHYAMGMRKDFTVR